MRAIRNQKGLAQRPRLALVQADSHLPYSESSHAYTAKVLEEGAGGRCLVRARGDPVLFGDLLRWDVADVRLCFDGLEASPSVAMCVL